MKGGTETHTSMVVVWLGELVSMCRGRQRKKGTRDVSCLVEVVWAMGHTGREGKVKRK